jgi:hypothetical protein
MQAARGSARAIGDAIWPRKNRYSADIRAGMRGTAMALKNASTSQVLFGLHLETRDLRTGNGTSTSLHEVMVAAPSSTMTVTMRGSPRLAEEVQPFGWDAIAYGWIPNHILC